MSSVLSYNVFDFTTVFAKADKNIKDKKRTENHEPTFVKQMLQGVRAIVDSGKVLL